jgi:UDP-glucose 4-epimerase
MKTKTVLVTGAAGFIGRYVAKEFSDHGYDVAGMGWGKFPDHQIWGISCWHECEVTLETLCAFADKPDVIVHCAGGSSVGYSVEYPRQDFCLTVDATSYVLEYIRLHSPLSRLLYPSSAAVYGQVNTVPISEHEPTCPISPYGVHKLMAEQLCQMYARRYGLSVAIVRLFSVYGDGLRKQLLWDACNKVSKGDLTFFGTGKEIRDWLHASDVAQLLTVAEKCASQSCPVINGGTGIGVNVETVLQLLMHAMGCQQAPVFSSTIKEGDPDALVSDITSASQLGWSPTIQLQTGIAAYVDWYKRCR